MDVIELGSSDDEPETAAKKLKLSNNVMVHIPSKLPGVSIVKLNNSVSNASKKNGNPDKEIIRSGNKNANSGNKNIVTGNKNINTCNKNVIPSNKVINPCNKNIKPNKVINPCNKNVIIGNKIANTVVKNVGKTKNLQVNPLKIQSKNLQVNPLKIQSCFSLNQKKINTVKPSTVKNPYYTNVSKKPTLNTKVNKVQKNVNNYLNSLPPDLTITRTTGQPPGQKLPVSIGTKVQKPVQGLPLPQIKVTQIQQNANVTRHPLRGANKRTTKRNNKKNISEDFLTVNLDDDDDVPETSSTRPQWYVRPEDQIPDESTTDTSNKEPEGTKLLEVTIEDSPVKSRPSTRKGDSAIAIEDSPIKSTQKGSKKKMTDTKRNEKNDERSNRKKRLKYSDEKELDKNGEEIICKEVNEPHKKDNTPLNIETESSTSNAYINTVGLESNQISFIEVEISPIEMPIEDIYNTNLTPTKGNGTTESQYSDETTAIETRNPISSSIETISIPTINIDESPLKKVDSTLNETTPTKPKKKTPKIKVPDAKNNSLKLLKKRQADQELVPKSTVKKRMLSHSKTGDLLKVESDVDADQECMYDKDGGVKGTIEITIEDSPIKPVSSAQTNDIGKELAIIIEDSPIKHGLNKISNKNDDISREEHDKSMKPPKSKKQLLYPNEMMETKNNMDDNNVNKQAENVNFARKTGMEAINSLSPSTDRQPEVPEESFIGFKIKDKETMDTNKNEFHPVYQEFIDLCFKLENSKDMEKIVEKKIKTYYRQVQKEYTESEPFIEMISSKIKAMQADPDKMYFYIKDIVDDLKMQRKYRKSLTTEMPKISYEDGDIVEVQKSNDDDNSKVNGQIRKLEKTLKKLHQAVQRLEEQEVDLDDENDSVYLLTESDDGNCSKDNDKPKDSDALLKRYKERLVRVHSKLCELKKVKMPSEPRFRIESRPGHPAGPCRKLEKWINRKVPSGQSPPFPDFHDVLRCVRDANDEDKLGWNEGAIEEEARDLFVRCGRTLQRRRQEKDWYIASSRLPNEKDPAEENEDLKKQLDENRRIATRNETEVFNKFADRERLLNVEGQVIEVVDDVESKEDAETTGNCEDNAVAQKTETTGNNEDNPVAQKAETTGNIKDNLVAQKAETTGNIEDNPVAPKAEITDNIKDNPVAQKAETTGNIEDNPGAQKTETTGNIEDNPVAQKAETTGNIEDNPEDNGGAEIAENNQAKKDRHELTTNFLLKPNSENKTEKKAETACNEANIKDADCDVQLNLEAQVKENNVRAEITDNIENISAEKNGCESTPNVLLKPNIEHNTEKETECEKESACNESNIRNADCDLEKLEVKEVVDVELKQSDKCEEVEITSNIESNTFKAAENEPVDKLLVKSSSENSDESIQPTKTLSVADLNPNVTSLSKSDNVTMSSLEETTVDSVSNTSHYEDLTDDNVIKLIDELCNAAEQTIGIPELSNGGNINVEPQ